MYNLTKEGFLSLRLRTPTKPYLYLPLLKISTFRYCDLHLTQTKLPWESMMVKVMPYFDNSKLLLNGIGTIIINRGDGIAERTVSIPQNTIRARAYSEENSPKAL